MWMKEKNGPRAFSGGPSQIISLRVCILPASEGADKWHNSMEHLIVVSIMNKFPAFLEPELSLTCSRESATSPYPESYKSVNTLV